MEQIMDAVGTPDNAQVDFSIRILNSGKLNLADFQNSVPLLRELTVVNDSDRELSNLRVRLESFPPFLKPKTWSIDACDPRSQYGIKDCDVSLAGIDVFMRLRRCLILWTGRGLHGMARPGAFS